MINSSFQSVRDWDDFQRYVRDRNRFYLTARWNRFAKALSATSQKRETVLKKGTLVARARIGSASGSHSGKKMLIQPLPHHEMLHPPPERAVEGRLNPSGIPYLYLANNKETALAEVRPWVGACVSVAYFKIVKPQRLIDLTKDFPKKKKTQARAVENMIWSRINESFSEPMSPDDSGPQYVPTQFLTEIFKAEGFDGVRYKSSLSPSGYNYLLFDRHAVKYTSIFVFRVGGVKYHFNRVGKR
jgi:RES domain-containing protein